MLPKKILLAEDDADDRSFFFDFLTGRKDIARITAVENGEEVFSWLENIQDAAALPDIIVLDQNMPKKNGFQTLQGLKSNSRYRSIPVFMYSTYADENLAKKSLACGARLVLAKPFSPAGYHEMIDQIFDTLQVEADGV
ncbi:MAG: response regulator [Williamsia sp.]|nr:response regulator [Williamsia sp.]